MNEEKKKVNRRDFLIAGAVAGAGLMIPGRGHGAFIPFGMFRANSGSGGMIDPIPGTTETAGSTNAAAASYYLLIDSAQASIIFTTGNRVNATSQLYTLPRYLQSSNAITVTLGQSSASATLTCIGGGAGGGGSPPYGCGWGGSSGGILIAPATFLSGDTVTLEVGKRGMVSSSPGPVSPYRSLISFSGSKYLQAGAGGSTSWGGAPAPTNSSAGLTPSTNTYNFDPSGQGYCNDNYYFSQSSPSGNGYTFRGAVFGAGGSYSQQDNGIDGVVCIKFA